MVINLHQEFCSCDNKMGTCWIHIEWKMDQLVSILKMAYRKHHLMDDSIGWDQLSDSMADVLCEVMGDKEFVKWNEEAQKRRVK